MLNELFGNPEDAYGVITKSYASTIDKMFRQERDWTCAIACLRTLFNGKFTEDELIEKHEIEKGPKYSKDIKPWIEGLARPRDYYLGCDYKYVNVRPAERLATLLNSYNVMVELTLNYAHWVVILHYAHLGSLADDVVTIYDPYFNKVRLFPAEEILSMWYGIMEAEIEHDFVAVRKEIIR